ncbi:MAG: hypothetical protein WD021_01090 [Rhodothermales bacterium]
MSSQTTRLTVDVTPSSRVDVIDIKQRIREHYGDVLDQYDRTLYCSHHTTAGYFDQHLVRRLDHSPDSLQILLRAFQELFPPNSDYHHDQLHLRTELTAEERKSEPRNADSHLTFIGSGLENCVPYTNETDTPVYFVDLDGVMEDRPRRRRSTVVGYNKDEVVDRFEFDVPVSGHAIDSINLKNGEIGLYHHLQEHVRRAGIDKGWIELDLDAGEQNAGLTVNEYETLLMQHDLVDVLRNPMRHVAAKGRSMLRDPKAIPGKAKNYAKYDLVHVVNQVLDRLGLNESLVERVIDRLFAFPASRFLRMKRSVRLLVCDTETDDNAGGKIIQGTYQSPILVQWKKSDAGRRRINATFKRCV